MARRASPWAAVGRAVGRALVDLVGGARERRGRDGRRVGGGRPVDDSPGRAGRGATRDLRRDELRGLRIEYSPAPDGDPDPGEVVWTWVPYVENDGRGKDRPVLIIARLPGQQAVVGCYLSTKPHPGFVNIGTGGWDSQRRDSYLSPERLLRVTDAGMRREGHQVDRQRFIEAARVVVARWRLTA